MRLGLGLSVSNIRQRTLSDRIAAQRPLLWYDPSDWSTLFQDSAGTTPVTAVGDPVGLILDKSGNGYHASQATAINRPTLSQDANGKYRLLFNGTNSRMSTAAIDLSSKNTLTIIAGVNKESDAASGIIAEFSANASTNNGAFYLLASNGSAANYRVLIKGVNTASATPTVAAPDVSVFSATATLAAIGAFLVRRDAAQITNSAFDFGVGNFGNHQLFIGHRSGGSLHLNGGLYGLIIRSVISTTAEIETAEKYMNFKSASY